jgi:predicted Zn finger-like uncharacterized protein
MKIVCPHCQAAYEVDIPGLKTKDVDVKCARCKSKFIVKKYGSDAENISSDQAVEFLAGGTISESLADEKEPVSETSSMATSADQSNDINFEDDDKLDDYLDKILEEELGSPDPSAITAQNINSPVEEVDTDLDSLLNDLIDKGLQADLDAPEMPVDESPTPEGSESYSDDLLGEIMSEEQQEKSAPSPTTENQKTEASKAKAPLEKEVTPPEGAVAPTAEFEQENPVTAEKEITDTEEETSESAEKSDEDLWAEAFAEQEATEQATDKANDEDTPAREETPEAAEKSDEEDLWAEAFAEQENLNESLSSEEKPSDSPTEEKKEIIKEEEKLPENAFSDDYDEADFEFKPKKKLFSIPKTRTGKIIMAGSLMAILLTAGGVYFTLQTFAPTKITGLDKAETPVPEGLTPNESAETPSASEEGPFPTPDSITGKDTGEITIDQELAQSEKLRVSEASIKDVASLNNFEALEAALSPRGNTVTIQTIMPVAYNINDIRILSFNLEVVMDNDQTADVLRDALPVFEQLTLQGVEELLHKKFYNDVLYVKEKLQKKIRNAINAKLEGGGHVKKVKFKEFSIQ